MPRRAPLASLRRISEINLTPLSDLSFLLLVTFIITLPLIEYGIPVNLPRGRAEEVRAREACTVTIDKAGKLYLNDVEMSLEALAAELRRRAAAAPETTVLVRADEAVPYGQVASVLRVLHLARVGRLALVTQAER